MNGTKHEENERRRSKVKLSRFGPKSRMIVIGLSVLLFAAIVTNVALAREIRVIPASPADPNYDGTPCDSDGVVNGVVVLTSTACDLVRVAAGFAPLSGPDAGVVPSPGDVIVLSPGVYTLVDIDVDGNCVVGGNTNLCPPQDGTGPVVIPGATGNACGAGATTSPTGWDCYTAMPNLEIRSMNGAAVTIINDAYTGAMAGAALLIVAADGVVIGGAGADQGVTVTAATVNPGPGIVIGMTAVDTGIVANLANVCPAGQADEKITIRNNYINNNNTDGVLIDFTGVAARPIEKFKILNNDFRGNRHGIAVDPLALASVLSIEDFLISDNYFDSNAGHGILFNNTGPIDLITIENNQIYNSGVNGILFNPTVTRVTDAVIKHNVIWNNGGWGILFSNAGDVDSLEISDNTDETGNQGITGNGVDGIGFNPFVLNISDAVITGNVINNNAIDGIWMSNTGDVNNLLLQGNNIRRNGANGVIIAPINGDFTDSNIIDNVFWNNGANGFWATFGAVPPTPTDINTILFDHNEAKENGNDGIWLQTDNGDISNITFQNGNSLIKNTNIGLHIDAGGTSGGLGSIDTINIDDLTSNESQNAQGVFIWTFSGDIDTINISNTTIRNNAGTGLDIRSTSAANRGDLDNVTIVSTHVDFNGVRGPAGARDGILMRAAKVNRISIGDPNATGVDCTASNNNDNGVLINSTDDMGTINIYNSEFNSNDRDHDTVGVGIMLDSNQDMDDVVIHGNSANNNNKGIYFHIKGANGRNFTVEDNVINQNVGEGLLFDASDDMSMVEVTRNSFTGNAIDLRISVGDRGMGINVHGNTFRGASGTGIRVESYGVTIKENDIREHDYGIDVDKDDGNNVYTCNNIVTRHGIFGFDALGLASSGHRANADRNFWGERSGPYHPILNRSGAGSAVSDYVDFGDHICTSDADTNCWLPAPCPTAPVTGAFFAIESFDVSPTELTVGETVTITYTVTNTGTAEGTKEVTLTITSQADGTVVETLAHSITVTQGATQSDTFNWTPVVAGVYEIQLSTQDQTSDVVTVTVSGGAMPWVCDYAGADMLVDGADLIAGIQDYAAGMLDGSRLITLIQYYATDTPCDQPLPGAGAAALAVPFSVESVSFVNGQFVVEGVGLAAIDVQVFDLTGRTVFTATGAGNTLAFDGLSNEGKPLANGVYLYQVTAYGLNGEVARSKVQKLAWLR